MHEHDEIERSFGLSFKEWWLKQLERFKKLTGRQRAMYAFAYLFGVIFVLSGAIAISALSIAGMLLLTHALWVLILAGILSGLIEAEVHAQSVKNAFRHFKTLFTLKHFKRLVVRSLLNEYANTLRNEVLAEQVNITDKEFLEQKFQDKLQEKNLELYTLYIEQDNKKRRTMEDNIISGEIIIDIENLNVIPRRIQHRIYWNRVGLVFSAITGLGATFVIAHSVQASLLVLLPSLAIPGIIFAIAIPAGIMFALWTYSNTVDLLSSQKVHQALAKFRAKFSRQENEKYYYLRIIGLSFLAATLTGFVVFASFATASTWLKYLSRGVALINKLKSLGIWLARIIVPLAVIPTFISTGVNFIQSFSDFFKISLGKSWKSLKGKIRRYSAEEKSLLQFLNPFRIIILIISVPFKILAFAGHIISMGTTSNNIKGVPDKLSTAFMSLAEIGIDANRFTPNSTHPDIPGYFLKCVLTLVPLYPLAALWDAISGKIMSPAHNTLPAWDMLKKSFKKIYFGIDSLHKENNQNLREIMKAGYGNEEDENYLIVENINVDNNNFYDFKLLQKNQGGNSPNIPNMALNSPYSINSNN